MSNACGMCRCCYAQTTFVERKLTRDLADALGATSLEQWANAIEVTKATVRERDELKEKVTQLEAALAQALDMMATQVEVNQRNGEILSKKSIELFHLKRSTCGLSGSLGNTPGGTYGGTPMSEHEKDSGETSAPVEDERWLLGLLLEAPIGIKLPIVLHMDARAPGEIEDDSKPPLCYIPTWSIHVKPATYDGGDDVSDEFGQVVSFRFLSDAAPHPMQGSHICLMRDPGGEPIAFIKVLRSTVKGGSQ